MSTKAHAPQALEFAAGYGTCVAVAVPKEVVVVYAEPEIIVDVTEELPVPVDDPDEPFYALVGLDTRQIHSVLSTYLCCWCALIIV